MKEQGWDVLGIDFAPGSTLLYVHHEMESDEVDMPAWLAENLWELKVVTLERRASPHRRGAGGYSPGLEAESLENGA
ncbi:hypothetical protein ACKFR8_02025 [Corynebacterium axilliensis]|uniref:hypothetical protein n=1 Tax=Corynebacterium sp. YSMAA5_1_F9 TaxID=3383591 RepID=UPI0038CF93FC